MSRFHDEFFRQGSPVHDALMIKCMQKDCIHRIIDTIDLSGQVLRTAPEVTRYWLNNRTVTICTLNSGKQVAWKGEYRNQGVDGPRVTEDYHGDKGYLIKCSHYEKCKHASDCTHHGKEWKKENRPYPKVVSFSYNIENLIEKTSYETEVIARNGNFILGYADAVIRITSEITINAVIDPGWTWSKFESLQIETDILIEAKPKITSIGEVIRQLKTYRDSLHRVHGELGYPIPMLPVIVTYTKLDSPALSYLKNENISVVVFEEEP